jgi:hypothetical protein
VGTDVLPEEPSATMLQEQMRGVRVSEMPVSAFVRGEEMFTVLSGGPGTVLPETVLPVD